MAAVSSCRSAAVRAASLLHARPLSASFSRGGVFAGLRIATAPRQPQQALTLAGALRLRCVGVRSFASEGGSAGKKSGTTGNDESESDRKFKESGEYDTQERYKRVGNPIAWANPTGGGVVEDTSSKHWTWVFPVVCGVILMLCLVSRWRNMRAENEEDMMEAPRISMPETSRFKYQPPPEERPEDLELSRDGREGDTLSSGYYGGGSSSNSSFSAPPASSSKW
ncbi:unnamed protein product [Polarella glacialis]|uniref:Uncharacterized protein n=1 Tax=Polarella glacialis TaxID=89957 RepID=A0A813D4M2_POLGL|nr:unnamed protein product [Polarella glacialis]|mmetsp:Transcript_1413/g.2208  ORF Transcript_1413/g.2208 Transcript_1413/m.2208 type:complete len:224 (-) Transcript_1413:164-835(-)|eukprot:CAMPEP_0115085350 /NCGR_PEP_ID=MMETSP0227-20121206/21875_1 /TAXON_ID=89957 /ORGANISM="Polarella glacialis, Strain CCMP 1383" /LENGTH=223 /DNA_ID=CAMNT_0002474475 /DNA_START=87 /DNA_END=758 /DNA_ORIENTATION=+